MAEPSIKLYYFKARGRTEAIRMLLTIAGVKFEDNRIDHTDWSPGSDAQKAAPFGQLPYMIYNEKKYAQSMAIAGFLGRKLGYYGKTDEDALKEDEVIHLVNDLRTPHMREWVFAPDAEKKAEKERSFREDLFPRFFGYFEKMLEDNGKTGYFVGDSMTMADMYVYDFLDTALGIDPKAIDAFPLLQKLRANVGSVPAIQAYLNERPATAIDV